MSTNNTYFTLADLKASPVAEGTAFLVQDPTDVEDGTFFWTLGDFTGQADDENIIKADSTALSVGAWVRQEAASLTATASGTGAVIRPLQSKLDEFVSVKDFGAVGDGVTDDLPAFQAATNTGKTVRIPPANYFLSDAVAYTGQVLWVGEGAQSTIICDGPVLEVLNGTDSIVSAVNLINKTVPWTILRDPNDWNHTPTVALSNDGYQPTINDQDIWASLTTAQQNQQIGPSIGFQGNSENVLVENITGRFVVIGIYSSRNSTVRNIDIHGGKGGVGAVFFWNIDGQSGLGNRAENIRVRYSSFNGVTFARNADGFALNIQTERCGESGLKFWKGEISGTDARCYNMTVANCKSNRHYFDGFDLCGDLPFADTIRTSHNISNIEAYGCHGTGINIDGNGHAVSNFKAWLNGDKGWWGEITGSSVSNLTLIGNNANDVDGNHEISESGSGNSFAVITVTSDSSLGHYAIYADGQNSWANVRASGRPVFFGNPGSIVAALTDVQDNQTGAGRLHNAEVADWARGLDERGSHYWPRRSATLVAAAATTGILTNATSGGEYGIYAGYVAKAGVLTEAFHGRAEAAFNVPFFRWSAPNSVPGDVYLEAGQVLCTIDETGHNLLFKVKYSDGTTVKTGSVALT
ncbi:hypothetical protein OK349_17805 [Sphingomonas sp. BT-65]|uniref:tail spike protein n=1 Tax=Sphingomonas sp. BT-65 TaxID=2989821 RepID=UPI0022359537|nr:tail spike protein [Sphingomonas sp. BT-65]MCW4463566.1 hypothetical protein [Sphingomonas sp. BT-65]